MIQLFYYLPLTLNPGTQILTILLGKTVTFTIFPDLMNPNQ